MFDDKLRAYRFKEGVVLSKSGRGNRHGRSSAAYRGYRRLKGGRKEEGLGGTRPGVKGRRPHAVGFN